MVTGPSTELGPLLGWGKKHLKKAGIEDFDVSAEILLGNLLSLKRSELLLNPEQEIDPVIIEEYKKLISARSRHVPLQYLIGYVEFYNIRLKCDPRALIPRPETEILVDNVIDQLKNYQSPKILDIGSGSGNIAIALAVNIKNSSVIGVDISGDAIGLAVENAGLNNVNDRVRFLEGDISDAGFVEALDMFDCIAANPPYVAEYEMEKLQPEVIDHEPKIALFSKEDPLRFFKIITNIAPSMLIIGGLMAFEIGFGQSNDVEAIMSDKFEKIEIAKDLAGIERVMTGILKEK